MAVFFPFECTRPSGVFHRGKLSEFSLSSVHFANENHRQSPLESPVSCDGRRDNHAAAAASTVERPARGRINSVPHHLCAAEIDLTCSARPPSRTLRRRRRRRCTFRVLSVSLPRPCSFRIFIYFPPRRRPMPPPCWAFANGWQQRKQHSYVSADTPVLEKRSFSTRRRLPLLRFDG